MARRGGLAGFLHQTATMQGLGCGIVPGGGAKMSGKAEMAQLTWMAA
jgi:hypothetical protein